MLVVAVLLAATSTACQSQTVCAAGATQPCVCTDGRPGAQFCSRDGMGWGPCQCTGPAVQPAVAVPEPGAVSPTAAPAIGAPAAAPAEPPAARAEPQPEPAPTEVAAEPTAGAPRTSSDVQNVIRRAMSTVRHCYERGLADDPSLEGRLTVRLEIMPQGSVASASIADDALRNPTVTGCILRSFRRLRFPATTEPGLQTVTYPLVLDSSM